MGKARAPKKEELELPFMISRHADGNHMGLHVRWEQDGTLRYVSVTTSLPPSPEELLGMLKLMVEEMEDTMDNHCI